MWRLRNEFQFAGIQLAKWVRVFLGAGGVLCCDDGELDEDEEDVVKGLGRGEVRFLRPIQALGPKCGNGPKGHSFA